MYFTYTSTFIKNCNLQTKAEKVPGTDVPRATKEIAVIASVTPTVHPKWDAKSPINLKFV